MAYPARQPLSGPQGTHQEERGGNQIQIAQPLLKRFPEILTRGENQSSRGLSAKGCGAFESHGTFSLVHPGLTQPGLEKVFAMQ